MYPIGNVVFYNDDNEIFELLSKLDKTKIHGNMTILEYLDASAKNEDLYSVFAIDNILYVLVKFGKKLNRKQDDSGLTLTVSNIKHSKEQLVIWSEIKKKAPVPNNILTHLQLLDFAVIFTKNFK